MNFVASAVGGGLFAIPSLISLFAKPPAANTIVVNVGIGDVNGSAALPGGQDLKGSAPRVSLYDIHECEIGTSREAVKVVEGGTIELRIQGDAGDRASRVPRYVRLEAGRDDLVCVSWLATTSSSSTNGDFRSWNAAMARACGIPWYPSVAPFGGVPTLFQPPCFWLANNGVLGFLIGMSARLKDFLFPRTPGGGCCHGTAMARFPGHAVPGSGAPAILQESGHLHSLLPPGSIRC